MSNEANEMIDQTLKEEILKDKKFENMQKVSVKDTIGSLEDLPEECVRYLEENDFVLRAASDEEEVKALQAEAIPMYVDLR